MHSQKIKPSGSVHGAGKTGYTRILESACLAQGREEILGTVASGIAPPTIDVATYYKVGADSTPPVFHRSKVSPIW